MFQAVGVLEVNGSLIEIDVAELPLYDGALLNQEGFGRGLGIEFFFQRRAEEIKTLLIIKVETWRFTSDGCTLPIPE